jgi:hypothetical protein
MLDQLSGVIVFSKLDLKKMGTTKSALSGVMNGKQHLRQKRAFSSG